MASSRRAWAWVLAIAVVACRDGAPQPDGDAAAPAPADVGARAAVGGADGSTPASEGSRAAAPDGAEDGAREPDAPTILARPDPLHGEVEPGDSLSKILHRGGLDAQEIHRVTEALRPVMDPATIGVGQRYDIELDEAGALLKFTFHRSITERAVVQLQEDGSLAGRLEQQATELREEPIEGEVDSSLWAALTARGHSPALVDVIVDVFAYDIDFFTATRQGDRFRLIVERHEIDGELVRYGRVLAARYEGTAAGTVEVLWWEPPGGGEGRYVDAEGRGVARTLLKTPLKYARISSGFDPKRMHPVLHRVKSHQGVDYAAPEGAPVWAAADGTIVFRDDKGGAGNMVILKHAGGLKTLYMHLQKFAEGQRVGQPVKAKTVIGYVGQTGLATGPHLHYGVQKHGRYVDPTTIESVRGPGVDAADRAKFRRLRERWAARLDAVGVVDSAPQTETTGTDDLQAE